MAEKPSLLLHVCCGPCATAAVERLGAEYDVTLFFANSNIWPREEYDLRLAQARKLAGICGLPLVEDAYDHPAWLACVAGMEAEPEGGKRCERCFAFNLRRAAQYAEETGLDFFTTTLTISPHKRSATIFAAGSRLDRFLAVDLKKGNGFKRSVALSAAHELYRQAFCGCEFSRR